MIYSRFSVRERKKQETIRAVAESMLFGFEEPQALEYIQQRLGRPISQAHYWRLVDYLHSEEYNTLWLNNHARIGFIHNLQRRIDLVEKLIQDTMQAINKEETKAIANKSASGDISDNKDNRLILALRKELREEILLAHELEVGFLLV